MRAGDSLDDFRGLKEMAKALVSRLPDGDYLRRYHDPHDDEALQSDESPAAAPEEEQWRPNPNPNPNPSPTPNPNPNPNPKPKPKPNPNPNPKPAACRSR